MKKIIFIISAIFLFCTNVYSGTVETSGSTAQTFITIVRADLNEPTATFWSDTEFTTWINEAVTEIVNQTRCLETTVTDITLTEADYDYAFTPSFLDVDAILYDSGDTSSDKRIFALDRVNINDIGHINERGAPKKYCLWNDQIIIWPIPNATISGTTLHVFYIPLPSGVTTSTSPIETPAYFDPAITDYVKAKALYKDNRKTLADSFMGFFTARIQTYFSNVVNRRAEKEVK